MSVNPVESRVYAYRFTGTKKSRIKHVMPWARTRAQRDAIVPLVVRAAGGAAALARKLGVSRAAVGQWRQIPVKHIRKVVRLSGFRAHQLRPDLYRDNGR